jgi:creatinine amidohydrolase
MDPLKPEVRYQMLRPAQIVARRRQCAIAYLPLGNVEWHGPQNPLGADTLQAQGAAIRSAQKGGGLVLPPLWYFAPLQETTGWLDKNRQSIAEQMELPPELRTCDFSAEAVRRAGSRYQEQLVDLLYFAQSLGFAVCVFVAGHYPLIDHATIAVEQFHTARKRQQGSRDDIMIAWACQEPTLRFLLDGRSGCGDHGGGWETSNCMALHPETVDLSVLPPRGQDAVGIGGRTIKPQDATAKQGWENIEAFSDLMIKEAHSRLAHPDWYLNCPYASQVGKWRDPQER